MWAPPTFCNCYATLSSAVPRLANNAVKIDGASIESQDIGGAVVDEGIAEQLAILARPAVLH